MLLRLLLFFCIVQIGFSQERVSILIDSLAQANSEIKKTQLSLSIAEELESSDWQRSLHYLDIAKDNAINDSLMAEVYVVSGNLYSNKDALDIALENYLQAYDYYEDKAPSERFRLENNLAIVYAGIDNKPEALSYFKKVLQYQLQEKDTLVLAQILNNMGNLYLGIDTDSAVVYFQKAEKLAAASNDPDLPVFVYTNLGRSFAKTDANVNARQAFQQALQHADDSTNPRSASFLYNSLAQFYFQNAQNDSALFYVKKVVVSNDTLAPYSFQQRNALGLLYQTLLKKEAYEKAASYYEKYNEVRDSIDLEDKRVNVERVLIEQKYRNQEKIRDLEEGKKRFRNYMVLFALAALLLLLGALLLRYRSKLKNIELEKQLATAKQKELNSTLQLKNKELIGKAMIEIHRTEIIEEILTELKQVRLKAVKKETQQAIDYIVKRLKRDTDSDLWDEFEIRFEQVHESFYKNLNEKHPDLTSRDKRLCALLKLNLTSKEIAQITGQSPKSVENARTRLRKKLNITHAETDLSAYLFNFD